MSRDEFVPVTQFPKESNFIDDGGQVFEIAIQVHYCVHSGRIQIPPAAEDGTSSVFIKTSAAWAEKILIWSIKRTGGVPDIPDFESSDKNDVLIEHKVELGKQPYDGANNLHLDFGWYRWGMKTVPSKTSGYKTVIHPYLRNGSQTTYSNQHFKVVF